jgi:hypothetical protein
VKLLADEGVDSAIVTRLRSDGHDVIYVAELSPGITDEAVAPDLAETPGTQERLSYFGLRRTGHTQPRVPKLVVCAQPQSLRRSPTNQGPAKSISGSIESRCSKR